MLPLAGFFAVGLACTDLGRIGCAVDADCCQDVASAVCVRNRCVAGTPTTTTTTPLTTTTTLPDLSTICRPTGADLAVLVHPRGAYYLNFRGRTADQQERDCLESTATSLVVRTTVIAGDLLDDATKQRIVGSNGLSLPLTRTQARPPYRGCLQQFGGCVWNVNPQGRNYQADWTLGVVLRNFLMGIPDAASVRFQNEPNLRDFLNVNSTFDGPADLPPLTDVPYDPDREDQFPLDTHHPSPTEGTPCFTGDCTGLDVTEQAHACDLAIKCGLPHDDCLPVAVAHAQYEAACGGDEDCQWRRRMPAFVGLVDPGWTDDERCLWAQVTDIFHRNWADAQRAGDTKTSLLEGDRHRTAHVCLNLGSDPDLQVILPEDGMNASDFGNAYGGAQSCRDLLPLLVAAYGITP